ncbi:MAG: thermonuclease family protein [bacterium]
MNFKVSKLNIYKKIIIILLFLTLKSFSHELSLLVFIQNAATTTATVTEVYDGDTIKIETTGGTDTVRLLAIDAGEMGEPYSDKAKDFLEQVFGKEVLIYFDPLKQKDKYGRLLGVIVYENKIFNSLLLENGLATRLFMENNILNFPEWEAREVRARKGRLNIWEGYGGNVMITEIHPNPPSYDTYEFAELYNSTDSPIDIGSATIRIGGYKAIISNPTIINPHSCLVICSTKTSPSEIRDFYNIPQDIPILSLKDFLLLNSYNPSEGLVITLKDPNGFLLDSLAYNLSWDNNGADNTGLSLQKVGLKKNNLGESKRGGLDDLNWDPDTPSPGRVIGPDLSHSTKDVFPKAEGSLGSVITYTISLINTGDMEARDVFVYDQLPLGLSFSQIKSKQEVILRDGILDMNSWYSFNNGRPDGMITIITNQGTYRSLPINPFNYPTIESLLNEINNDKKAGARISYSPISDKFTLSKDNGYIIALYEEGEYPFFSAIKIEPCDYCTGTYSNGVISWNVGNLPVYATKTISFSAQVIGKGSITNYATITSAGFITTTNLVSITVSHNPPLLITRPIEDSSEMNGYDFLDDDADIDGRYRVIFPIESEPCGIIEYEIEERIGTSSWYTMGTGSGSSKWYEIPTRAKGSTYSYRVRARNTAGYGNWSNPSDGIKVVDKAGIILPNMDFEIKMEGLNIKIPKGAFSGTITFTIQRKDIGVKVASPAISSILPNSIYELIAITEEYSEGAQPVKPLTLILPYQDPDFSDEIDDLSYRIYRLVNDRWIIVEGEQIVNPVLNTIQCSLNSISIYGIGFPIGLSISNVIVQPNPVKTNKYDRVRFYGLNGRVTISVFNIAGELVFKGEFYPPSNNCWNLLNNKGEKVSSGVYFALIDDGKEKVIRKFAIIK